ncbi:hypothetical protein DBZ36_01560 [Alginatibacterium sediminis]|uniref:DUF6701 domain-containing protein n=1 Tax=Alginatibacterium sediminis TaxID=2164068 RepID=A0A420EL83_9ALTE|nr:DUF6701 domain-containing protein [Alginatibacterium sediminis]RKF21366.1 hypothetical protein DBZ36_01560 [Alginatibacterium sediminis]
MKISKLIVSILLLIVAGQLRAEVSIPVDDFESYFPAVAQGHLGNNADCNSNGDHLIMQGSSTIDGSGGAVLDYCSNPSWSSGTCDDGSGGRQRCEISGNPITGITLPAVDPLPSIPALPSKPIKPSGSFIYSSNNDLSCSGGISAFEDEYDTITLNDGCVLYIWGTSVKVNNLVVNGSVDINFLGFFGTDFNLWVTNFSIGGASNLSFGSIGGSSDFTQINVNSFSSPSSRSTIQSQDSSLQLFFHQSAQLNNLDLDSEVVFEAYGNSLDNTNVSGDVHANGDVNVRNNSVLSGNLVSQLNAVTLNQSSVAGDLAAAGVAKLENSASVAKNVWSSASNVDISSASVGENVMAQKQLTVSQNTNIAGYSVSNQGNTIVSGSTITGSVYSGSYTSIELSTLGDGLRVVGQFDIQDSNITGNIVGEGSSVFSSMSGNTIVTGDVFKGEGKLDISGTSEITGNVYGHGEVSISGQSGIYGRVNSQKLRMNGQGFVYIEPPVPETIFLWGKVSNQAGGAQGRVDFGSTLSDIPVVFAMSSIDPTDANNDGPIAVQVSNVSTTGFDYWVRIPPGSITTAKESDFHWIASSVGSQVQTIDGVEFYAGTTTNNESLLGPPNTTNATSIYQNTGINANDYPVVLTQVQTLNNRQNQNSDACWFTSRSGTINGNVSTAIDASEAYDGGNNPRCQPGNVRTNSLDSETVAYLAAKVGTGQVDKDSVSYKFQFGRGETLAGGGVIDPNGQCSDSHTQTFQTLLFSNPPSIVASINGRLGNNGGWLRRCSISNTQYNLMVEEDQYQNSERSHVNENISYFAIEDDPVVNNIDHYRLSFSSSALACQSQELTVRACIDETCSTEYSEPANVKLYKNNVEYSDLNFTGNTAESLWHTDGGSALLDLRNGNPDAAMRCFVDGAEVSDNSQCLVNFEQAGLLMQTPTQLACKTSGELEMYAVQQSTTNPRQCLPLLQNQQHDLLFTFDYQNPSNVVNQASISIKDLSTSGQTLSLSGGQTNTLRAVQFDATGAAKVSLDYPEVGSLKLAFELSQSVPDNSGQTIELEGSSQWVSQPQGIYFSGGVASCLNTSCSVQAKAQESFNFAAQAVCWVQDNDSDYSDNPVVQNFELANIGLQAYLEAPTVAAGDPSDGTLGAITTESIAMAQGASANSYSQSYSEVGSFSLELSSDLTYLNTTIDQSRSSSDHYGRFTPAYLELIEQVEPLLAAQCSTATAFTYMDQPFKFDNAALPTIRVLGFGSLGGATSNYQIGDWWRFANAQQWDTSYSHDSLDTPIEAVAGSTQYSPSSQTQKLAWLEDTELLYQRSFDPVVPFFAEFDLTLAADSLFDLDNICYRDSASAACLDFVFEDIAKDKNFLMRYGRLQMNDVSGSPYQEFAMPVRVEYFDGNVWLINVDDSCSTYTGVALSDVTESYDPALSGDQLVSRRSNTTQIVEGESELFWSATGSSAYIGTVTAPLVLEPWLQWFWDGEATGLIEPKAKAIFGAYRGHDRVLYWRELGN